MSTNELKQALEIVAPRILEEAAFIFSQPLEGPDQPDDEWTPVGVELLWEGPSNGMMRLWAEPALLPVFAANLLGIEEDDPLSAQKGLDAVKEILNMMVGNSLTEAWGPGPIFHLHIPEAVDAAKFTPDRVDGIWLSAEGRPMLLWCGT